MTKNLIWRGIAFSIMLLVGGCGSDASASPAARPTPRAGGSFAVLCSTPSMNQARFDATATLLPNGTVLIAGGIGPTSLFPLGNALDSVELYGSASNSFAPPASTPTMNTARYAAAAALLPNGTVLIVGGADSNGNYLATVELYDPATNSFAPAASLPTMNNGRADATATLLPNGKVLIAGGYGVTPLYPLGNALDSVELYDPASNSFASAASLPTMNKSRLSATATLLPNGEVLIAGGYIGKFVAKLTNSADLYDPATNSFAASTPLMNEARDQATATLLANGKVLIAGGMGQRLNANNPYPMLNDVDLYDPASNSFASAASTPLMNQARAGATATLLNNGNVLVVGGLGETDNESIVDLYDPATNTFFPAALTPRMNYARSDAAATLLPNGRVLIAGGTGVFGPLNSTDLYAQ